MKKTLAILGLMLSFGAVCAYEIDANSIFRQGNSVGLKPNSRYTISCPSIIENVENGEKSNIKFFFMDNEPFKVSDRAASTLVIRTYEPSNSYFKVFTQDGNTQAIKYNVNEKYNKMGAIVGNCRIEP